MPLPWKKVKSAKISQLVNDHLHNSQKRRDGSSLVVATGFPTSLIDLFMKNREKLKKPSKKKRVKALTMPPVVTDPVIARSSAPPPSPLLSPSRLIAESRVILPSDCTNEILAVEESDVDGDRKGSSPSEGNIEILAVEESDVVGDRKGRSPSEDNNNNNEILAVEANDVDLDQWERGVDATGVLLAVLKMVLVVGLAWWIKKLTLGITLSAFLLFFLDYMGKHVHGFLKPCSEAKGVLRILRLVIGKVSAVSRFHEDKFNKENCRIVRPVMKQGESCTSLENYDYRNQEIQPVESEREFVSRIEEIRCENEIKEESGFEGRLGFRETKLKELLLENDEFICGVVGSDRITSKKDKIKSKMKKCFVKKLRSFGKEQHEISSECHVSQFEEVEVAQFNKEEESESITSRLPVDVVSANSALGGFSEINDEVEDGVKELKSVQIWSRFVLGFILLIGLVRGRAFALMLTLSWFLLLKLVEALKVPVIRWFQR